MPSSRSCSAEGTRCCRDAINRVRVRMGSNIVITFFSVDAINRVPTTDCKKYLELTISTKLTGQLDLLHSDFTNLFTLTYNVDTGRQLIS